MRYTEVFEDVCLPLVCCCHEVAGRYASLGSVCLAPVIAGLFPNRFRDFEKTGQFQPKGLTIGLTPKKPLLGE